MQFERFVFLDFASRRLENSVIATGDGVRHKTAAQAADDPYRTDIPPRGAPHTVSLRGVPRGLFFRRPTGSEESPSYSSGYAPQQTGIDLFGLDPYPCRREYAGCRFANITASVRAAEATGFPTGQLVPVYQAFSYHREWLMPTPAQEEAILATWGALLPRPAFDYTYSWGREGGDALVDEPAQRAVFAAHNGSTSGAE